MLVDCRATYNFVSQKLASELGLTRTETPNYGVIMGLGTAVRGGGICKKVVLTLLEMTVKEDFLPLELGSIDVVLGMLWLKQVGKMQEDWPALTMTFEKEGRKVKIQGDPTLTRMEVTFKKLARAWNENDQRFLIELRVF